MGRNGGGKGEKEKVCRHAMPCSGMRETHKRRHKRYRQTGVCARREGRQAVGVAYYAHMI